MKSCVRDCSYCVCRHRHDREGKSAAKRCRHHRRCGQQREFRTFTFFKAGFARHQSTQFDTGNHFDRPSDVLVSARTAAAAPAQQSPQHFTALARRLACAEHAPGRFERITATPSPVECPPPRHCPHYGPPVADVPQMHCHQTPANQRCRNLQLRDAESRVRRRLEAPWSALNCGKLFSLLLLAIGSLCQVSTASGASLSRAPFTEAPSITTLAATNTPFAIPSTTGVNYEMKPPSPKIMVPVVEDQLTPPTRFRRTSPQYTGPRYLHGHEDNKRLINKYGQAIEIRKKGKVRGSTKMRPWSILQLRSGGAAGKVVILGVKSGRFLCMDKRGRLRGQSVYNKAMCVYDEEMVKNHFVYFRKVRMRKRRRILLVSMYLGFDRRGSPKRGRKVQRNSSVAHFQKVNVAKTKRKRPRIDRQRKRPGAGVRRRRPGAARGARRRRPGAGSRRTPRGRAGTTAAPSSR